MDSLDPEVPPIDLSDYERVLEDQRARIEAEVAALPPLAGPSPLVEIMLIAQLTQYADALRRHRAASLALRRATQDRREIAAAVVQTLERHDHLYDLLGASRWTALGKRRLRLGVFAFEVPSVGRRTTVRLQTLRHGDDWNNNDDIEDFDDVVLPPKPSRRRRVLPCGVIPPDRRLLRRLAGRQRR